jgi:AAA+ superfamily predicted ATPase
VSPISILVAATTRNVFADAIAEGIVRSVEERSDMTLLVHDVLVIFDDSDVREVLNLLLSATRCALVLVGRPIITGKRAHQLLEQRADLVVLQVDVGGDGVQIRLRDPRLEALLDTLHDLMERIGAGSNERIARVQLETVTPLTASGAQEMKPAPERPLLRASMRWVHAVLKEAVERVSEVHGSAHGFSLNRQTLLDLLEDNFSWLSFTTRDMESELDDARDLADPTTEPLAAADRVFGLGPLEFRLMLLALAPEFDARHQLCLGFLQEDMGRRIGTMGMYCGLLGAALQIRAELAHRGALARSLAFENRVISADEPLRLDPFLTQWLLGESTALAADPRIRRTMRFVPWPGAMLLERSEDQARAAGLMEKLGGPGEARWQLLGGDDPAGWRAILELGAQKINRAPIRIDPTYLAGIDMLDVEDCATRIGRLARLTRNPLAIDVANVAGIDGISDRIDHFLATLARTRCHAAVICPDYASVVKQLGDVAFDLISTGPLSRAGRVAAVRVAARKADAYLLDEDAESISNRYPLSVGGIEHALRLAASFPADYDHDSRVRRFTAACRELAIGGISQLAERIEPVFHIDDIVLPLDRKRQLIEIVDHIRLAPKVLDGWKFRDQLPYGRGVTALFFGPSGTGKTMAAMGIARTLGIQLLRVDLSRVVSKYIGDTEKNIDRVFSDAQRSGSAILIDEADALLGKRSEVKDAHDRYANIEVAYLLQRMEAYEGLAILTSNMRQNLDAAFLRRLRFIVDFPRPDVTAREQIWRFCLPEDSHDLNDAAFRQLARKIDLTGGHIRQITLRAAFIAAAADKRIQLEHIAEAARAEFAKLGMPPVDVDLNGGRRAA